MFWETRKINHRDTETQRRKETEMGRIGEPVIVSASPALRLSHSFSLSVSLGLCGESLFLS